jgi:hypothetical protein
MIRSAFNEHYAKPKPTYRGSGLISVSNLGRCIRSVLLGLSGVQGGEFAQHIRECMDLGIIYEQHTESILREKYGSDLHTQFVLKDKIWSGKADFLLTPANEQPVIVEHKATNGAFFDYNGELPKWEHVCQLWLYGQLYNEIYHVKPQLILYYRAWGSNFAEFSLHPGSDFDQPSGLAIGQVNGQKVKRPIAIETLDKRRKEFESAYALLPNVPEVPFSTPCDAGGCLFRGNRSCAYFESCWENKT